MSLIDITPHWIKKTYIAPALLAWMRSRQYIRRYYTATDTRRDIRPAVIFMVDGRFNHGGLSDRLWGLISTYIACEKKGLEFKVNWVYPFRLTTFLEPAEVDWRITPEELTYDPRLATPVFVNNNHNVKNQWKLLMRIGRSGKRQEHVYSPAHIERDRFGEYFALLFRPTAVLQNAIDEQQKAIGGTYVSITFRFQQLLGDFKEGNFPTLAAAEQQRLLDRSIATIEEIRRRHPEVDRILVTSDSGRMLQAAAELPYVYTIPGKLIHMSFTDESEAEMSHLKAFLDFFMIGGARKVYFAQAPGIYGSTFAHTASRLHKAPYEVIDIV
ncbi:MAG: hypothetical protein K2M61_07535 [Muribaculaceae bacterium]|nr:hypothetical protein [Muribaculaceae bacterium]